MLAIIGINVAAIALMIGGSYQQPKPQPIKIATPATQSVPATIISHAVPAGLATYLLYKSYKEYSAYNANTKSIDDALALMDLSDESRKAIDSIENFFRTECVRAGHSKPEKIKCFIKPSEEISDDYSAIPGEFGALKTKNHHIIVMSLSEMQGLLELLFYAKNPESLRRGLFFAQIPVDKKPDTIRHKSNIDKFLNDLFVIMFILNDVDEDYLSDTCAIEYQNQIADLEKHIGSTPEITPTLIKNLTKIAYTSNRLLLKKLDKVFDMWAAAIHHETGHFKQLGFPKVRLAVKSSLIAAAYGAFALLPQGMSPQQRLAISPPAIAASLLGAKALMHALKYRNECNADSYIVDEERYVQGALHYFYIMGALSKESFALAWKKGYCPWAKAFSAWITDEHPSSINRARYFAQWHYKMKHPVSIMRHTANAGKKITKTLYYVLVPREIKILVALLSYLTPGRTEDKSIQ